MRDRYCSPPPAGSAGGLCARRLAGLPDALLAALGTRAAARSGQGTEWDYEGPGIPETTPEERQRSATAAADSARSRHAARPAGCSSVNSRHPDRSSPTRTCAASCAPTATRASSPRAPTAPRPAAASARRTRNLQLPQVGPTAFFGFGDGFKKRYGGLRGRQAQGLLQEAAAGPGRGPGPAAARDLPDERRPPAREDGETCPAPAPGIMIYTGAENPILVASFKIGDCTEGPGGFTAISSDGAWRLEVGISNFSGFGDYEIPYGGPDPPRGHRRARLGTFTNETWAPPGLPFAGRDPSERRQARHGPRVHRVPHRRRVGGDQGRGRDDLRVPGRLSRALRGAARAAGP